MEIKIIFNKKLISCKGLFYDCKNIIEIDLSKFDCSNILSCYYMFFNCYNVKKINIEKLDFKLVNDFSGMFENCISLDDIDISNINTKNSKTFKYMFYNCYSIKKIDVSKFNISKCESIKGMFKNCKNINEIDMINWDMSNLKYTDYNPIDYLFDGCEKLRKIKISGNIKKEEVNKNFNGRIFSNICESGELIMRKDVRCNIPLDGDLPSNWTRNKE